MLTRIFGRKKYGKTTYCFDIMKKCVSEKKKCFFIVPEQYTFSCEKKITDEIGNHANMYVEVLSFTRLCSRVFRTFGGISNNYLDSVGKVLCMSKVLSTLGGELSEYSASSNDIGFAASAVKTAEEFSAYNITSRDIELVLPELESENASLGAKLKDISLLSAAYRAELKSIYRTDGESLDMLSAVLSKNDFFGGACVIIDSFYGFTPQELRIIRHVLRQSQDVFVTFCTQKGDNAPVFARPAEAAASVGILARDNGADIQDVCLEAPDREDDISFIERNFTLGACFNTGCGKRSDKGENIRVISCRNPIDEAKAVSSVIYSLIADGKTHFRDIAVCARDIASFEGIIDVFLEKADIPYTFSAKEDLLTKPIISYILTTADFVTSWKQQSFLGLLKTGLVRVTSDDAALLENYVRTWNINGKKEFLSDWFMNPAGYVEGFTDKDSKLLEIINSAKDAVLDPAVKFREDVSSADNCHDIASAVYRLMCDSAYAENIENEDDERFWNLVISALDEIVRVYGYDDMNIKQFSELFKTVINEYGLMDIPEKVDSVLIGSVDLIRSETVKYMFVLGCNNEYFPQRKQENSIFSDNEKHILQSKGINSSAPANDCAYDEFFLAYNIFCDPYEKLYLLYSASDLDGKSLRRSVLADAVCNLFSSDLSISYPFADPISNITTKSALSDDMYFIGDSSFVSASKSVLSDDAEYFHLFSDSDDILNADGKLSDSSVNAYFGDVICSSPSRFENYSKCRFSYFSRHLLKLKPEVKAELDSVSTGLVSHKILELFVRELAESKLKGRLFTKDQARIRVKELLDTHFIDITHSRGNDDGVSKRFRYLYGRLYTILAALSSHLVDELAQSEFVPADFEVSIGISDGTIKSVPIEIHNTNGEKTAELRIVGQVDRADVYNKDGKTYVRIIDYKTGHRVFRKDEVAYGFNLQMLLYLYCIALSETKKYGDTVVPAGVLYIPVRKPETDALLSDSTEMKSESELARSFKGDGLLVDIPEILDAMDKGITGRFIPASMTKSGKMDSRSKIASLENMGELLKKAAEVSGKLASLMREGNIQTNPYRNVYSSCEHCDYKAVCRIDRKNDSIRYSLEEV